MALWTTEEDEKLKQLYAEGYSCRQIAAELSGKTRNAVIGRVHRLKLPLRGSGVLPPKAEPRKARGANPSGFNGRKPVIIKPPRTETELRCAAIDPLHVSILDLQPDQCRWPYGETSITFCGHQTFQGSYCASHFFLSIGPGTSSEQAAHKVSKRKLEGAW